MADDPSLRAPWTHQELLDHAQVRVYEVAEILHGHLHKSKRIIFCRSDLDLAKTIVVHLDSREQPGA